MPPPSQPVPGWQNRPHAYGDLIGPGAGMPEGALQAPAMPPMSMPGTDAPPIPGQRTPEPQAHFAPAQPMGMPPGVHAGGPMAPPRGPMAPPAPADEPKPERKARIIVGVLVICVALLAAAFGGLILVDKLINGATFAVGDCVKQSENAAVKADCGEPGAFRVVASVSDSQQCDDQTQPHVQQGSVIYCLTPAKAGNTDVTPTTTPAAGTPTPGPSATK
jgi:hypothetical protein